MRPDWELEDPAGPGPDNVRITPDDIERRVQELLEELAADQAAPAW